jgi:ABC-type dipeptide/oligopeptide/nickel transport system permease component/outer membrane protein assembly factor BamB
MTDRSAGVRPAGRARGAAGLALLLLGIVVLGSVPSIAAGTPPPPAATPSATAAVDWTTLGGSNNRSGFTSVDGPSEDSLISQISPPGLSSPALRSSAVTNGTVVYFADALGDVYAYNQTGRELWSGDVASAPVTPDLYNGTLFDAGSDGRLSAFNATDGKVLWRQLLGGAAVGGIAVASTRDGTDVLAGSTAGSVLVIGASNGTIVGSFHVGGPLAGAPAIEGSTLVVASTTGTVTAYNLSDPAMPVLWSTPIGANLSSGAAASYGLAVLGDLTGNVTALHLNNGTVAWRSSIRTVLSGDTLEAAPAIGDGRVFLATQLGALIALDVANGSMAWNRTVSYTGYLALASPAVAPNGVYFSDASQELVDLTPSSGAVVWTYSLGFSPAYGTPTLEHGELIEGDDLGDLITLGRPGGALTYRVSGTVVSTNGTAVPDSQVSADGQAQITGASGLFALSLPNGTFELTASAPGFYATFENVTVAGPLGNLTLVLDPVPSVTVRGTVVDGYSGQPLPGIRVTFYGAGQPYPCESGPGGAFAVSVPVGIDAIDIGAGGGYAGLNELIDVPLAGLTNLTLVLPPVVTVPSDDRTDTVVFSLAAILAGVAVAAAYRSTRRREELGQPTGLLGPFGRYILMRSLLLPFQAIAVLAVLYFFGTVLPSAARHQNPCVLAPTSVCAAGSLWSWSIPWQAGAAFLGGFAQFVWNMFTLNWGLASFGNLREPVTTFLAWWGPDSVQLALFALPISAGVAWLVGLYGGAKRDGGVDVGARILSGIGLLVPSFLLVLLFLGTFYVTFSQTFGDTPYGILPTTAWWGLHGGYPAWIGEGANTLPTGLPLVDGALHGDWSFEEVVLVKTLWQAAAIAVVYTAIFLRYARSVVAEAFQEPHLTAARARGVDEGTILWRHTGRRVLPLMLLVFGATLPAYVGTQAVVEALANDTGLGTLLLGELTHVGMTGFGLSQTSNLVVGNLYQVMVFLLVILVLIGNVFADAVARYLDPRLLRGGP